MGVSVSVVVPVYNAEEYLHQCVDSLISQTLKDVEFIFVDDGSTDGSVGILEDYQKHDSRIQILKQQNLHAGVARNNGMKVATGKYLMFLDSDDFFELNMLQKCYETAEKNNAEIVGFKFYEYDNKTGSRKEIGLKSFHSNCRVDDNQRIDFFRELLSSPWTKFFLREFIVKNKLAFQDLLNTNDEFFCRMAIYLAHDIYYIDTAFVNYRINNSLSLQGTISKDLTCGVKCIEALKKEIKNRGIVDSAVNNDVSRMTIVFFEKIFSPKFCVNSIEEAYDYLKRHIIPDIFDDVNYIPKDSIIERVYYSNSLVEFLLEDRIKCIIKKDEENNQIWKQCHSSFTFRLGYIILLLPNAAYKIVKKILGKR